MRDDKRILTGQRVVSIAFVVGMVLFIANAVVLFRNLTVLNQHRNWVEHSYVALTKVDSIQTKLAEYDTNSRQFVLTGNEEFADNIRNIRRLILETLIDLKQMTRDDPTQVERLNRLDLELAAVSQRFDAVAQVRRDKGLDAAVVMVQTERGRRLMDAALDTLAKSRSEEQRLLNERNAATDVAADAVRESLVVETAAMLVFLVLAYFFIHRHLVSQDAERKRLAHDAWIKTTQAELNEICRGNHSVSSLCKRVLTFFADTMQVPVGAFYAAQGGRLELAASSARGDDVAIPQFISRGQGLVGEAAVRGRIVKLEQVPAEHLKLKSALGESSVRSVIVIPVVFEKEVQGVIELGSLNEFTADEMLFFAYAGEYLGVSLDAAQSRQRTQELLEETQRQAEELQTQQEELRTSNEELEVQASSLKDSQERLQQQQEELRQTNEELQEQASLLEQQKDSLAGSNEALRTARLEVEIKAREIQRASQYKSEFIANMSHELRTPLNSLLILSTLLAENEEGNLTAKQVDFAKTIYRSGSDLLSLISDILDLSKVEAGKLTMHVEDVNLTRFQQSIDRTFREQAEQKGLKFVIEMAPNLPEIRTDSQRVEQIIKNFISNAIKFTAEGTIAIKVAPTKDPDYAVAIAVSDSGIGIPQEKLDLIFEAFQQADGTTSREYGGTGLGLTISRELAALLHGKIQVSSRDGEGSTFTLLLPKQFAEEDATVTRVIDKQPVERAAPSEPVEMVVRKPAEASGDVGNIKPGDRVVVIIEDDPEFAKILLTQAHKAGFKALLAGDGELGLRLVKEYQVHGVLLDLKLPDVSGFSVLERLKGDPKTRHLPVHVVSGMDSPQTVLKMGAIGYLTKPVERDQLREAFGSIEAMLDKTIKHVLIVEDDQTQRFAMSELLKGDDIQIHAVGTGREAIEALETSVVDCMILDLRLPDISGFELLELLDRRDRSMRPPVVVYTGKDLAKNELDRLRRYSESIIIKGAKSPERLLDEVSLFLHRVEGKIPAESRAILSGLRGKDEVLEGRRVLLVDDDMRNIFALANALSSKGLDVKVAKDGLEAVTTLEKDKDIDLVLMDIMMPKMDGYEAMRKIRGTLNMKGLPIIALTAKAMKEDQEKCLAAGANDYLPKPINVDRLLSLLRVWMPQRGAF